MAEHKSKKKIKTGLTISRQLSLISITFIILIILLGLFILYFINRIKDINANYAIILSMDDCIEKMTDAQSQFLLEESYQKEFYIDENVNSVLTFKGYSNKLISLVEEFSVTSKSCKLINKQEIDSLGKMSMEFKDMFDSLLVLTREKGFKDYGLIGEMQDVAHNLESNVTSLDNKNLYVYLLQLRRDEKNYFLRKDPNYFERFKDDASEFKSFIDTIMIDAFISEQLISKTIEYQNLLEEIMYYDNKIGLTSSNGILSLLNEKRDQIKNLNESFIKSFSVIQVHEIKNVKIRFVIMLVIIITTLSLIIKKIRVNISTPFNNIKESLNSLSLGVIPKSLSEEKSSQEIREITRVLNQIVSGFRNTIQFAEDLKKGEFDNSFEPLSEKDELGTALLEMKNGLVEAQAQREIQQIEEKTQIWINKGTANFAEILNKNYKNTEEFSYSIISSLVKYLDANQGGFFITVNDNREEPYLKLVSAIAYDRRKFADGRIAIGEGLVGASVVENNIIYRTEIPENYISIKSGLGGSNPRVLLIVPLVLDGEIYGAIEIASFKEFKEYELEFVKTISESITTTMSSVKTNEATQKLLDQTQAQAEQIIQAEEEMRQNLEEMQATQEEAARREEKLREELDEANITIDKLNNQLNELISNTNK